MNRLKRNKNFIPDEFYNKKEKLSLEEFKRIICMFFILNLLLIPNTIGYIQERQNKNKENLNPIDYSCTETYSTNEIKSWINSIFVDGVLSSQINQNDGEITLNDLDDFYNLNLQKKIDITYITSGEENYKVGVKLNE